MRVEQLCYWLNVKKGFIVKYIVNTEDIQQRALIADSCVQLKKMHSIETGNADFQFQLSILIYLQNVPSVNKYRENEPQNGQTLLNEMLHIPGPMVVYILGTDSRITQNSGSLLE